jgi:hypothetical protein
MILNKYEFLKIVSISDDNEPPFHTISGFKVLKFNTTQKSIFSTTDLHKFVSLVEESKARREVYLRIFQYKKLFIAIRLIYNFKIKLRPF